MGWQTIGQRHARRSPVQIDEDAVALFIAGNLVKQDTRSVGVMLEKLGGLSDVLGTIGALDDAQISHLLQLLDPLAKAAIRQQILRLRGAGKRGHGFFLLDLKYTL